MKPCPGDVSVEDDDQRMVESVIERHGVSMLSSTRRASSAATSVSRKRTRKRGSTMSTSNLTGMNQVCRFAVPRLRETHGALTLVANQLAHISSRGYATYSATKHAVLGLVRSLAIDLGPDGVRVNAISPGVTEMDMAYVECAFAAMRDRVAETIPLRRVGRAEDMAGPAVFLASDDSAWMTGQSLVVDGGFTVQ
jgi:NAD(P)-dependent dehydrogenase (short-subunit alcohol dehydrogenase family)